MTGDLIGQETESGFFRGAAVGTISGAVFSIEVFESSLFLWQRENHKRDDVKEKKPDPSIYLTALKRLGVSEKDCLVVEDSVIRLQAATRAGMSCVITYTSSTAEQDFGDDIAIYPDLGDVGLRDLESLLENVVVAS